jgi:hypothetical protein
MSTVHLDSIGMINDFKPMEGGKKQKAVWGVVIEMQRKKGISRDWLVPLFFDESQ